MYKELINYLLNYAYDLGIGYKIRDMDPDWVPVYVPWENMIVINSNWKDQKQIALQIAHEIGHALDGDSEFEYKACFSAMSKIERAATRQGLHIMIEYLYADACDVNEVNYQQFMEAFDVPCHYEGDVKSLITEYFESK